MKTCRLCGEDKQETDFYLTCGRDSKCKACAREAVKAARARHAEHYKEYVHERRSHVKQTKTQSLSHSTPADFLDSCLSNCDSIDARKKQIDVAMKRIAKNCDSYVFELRVPGDSLWGRMQ